MGAEVKLRQALESRRFLRGVDACTVAGSRPDVTAYHEYVKKHTLHVNRYD